MPQVPPLEPSDPVVLAAARELAAQAAAEQGRQQVWGVGGWVGGRRCSRGAE